MSQLLGLLILSFFITSILLVPFIDLLFRLKMSRKDKIVKDAFNKETPILNRFNAPKIGTPIGGGILIILVTTILSLWSYGLLGLKAKPWELFVLLFAFISFGLLGLYDDIRKTFGYDQSGFFGLRMRHKLILQSALSLIIAAAFFFFLNYDFIYVHWLGTIKVSILFIPLAAFVIVAFANAFNITDGLDGLSCGTLTICLIAFWVIAATLLDPTLAVFIALWVGSLIAFLYFNVYPARIQLGDTGALAFGATLAVVGLLTGKILAIVIIGGIFFVEILTSMIQLISKKYLGRKFFEVAPLHLLLRNRGWEEPKVVARFWLAGIMLAVLGLWIAVIA